MTTRNDRISDRRDTLSGMVAATGTPPSEADIETAIGAALAARALAPRETGESVTPYVSESRWVADCEACRSGMACSPGVDRATCVECGAVYAVTWPDEQTLADVAELLLARKQHYTRNWLPGEAVSELIRENRDQKITVPAELARRHPARRK